jgi:hypothetical protein
VSKETTKKLAASSAHWLVDEGLLALEGLDDVRVLGAVDLDGAGGAVGGQPEVRVVRRHVDGQRLAGCVQVCKHLGQPIGLERESGERGRVSDGKQTHWLRERERERKRERERERKRERKRDEGHDREIRQNRQTAR